MFEEKKLTLLIYETDTEGKPINYSVTNMRQPESNCISVRISLKESLQIEKLQLKMEGFVPKINYLEPLLEVKEGEFGLELVEPLLIGVSESADES